MFHVEGRIFLLSCLYCIVDLCCHANNGVAYEETQSNRVSDFRDFECSLLPKAILFDFYFIFMN